MEHDFIKTGDKDAFRGITDSHGEVVLKYCRCCKAGEGDLTSDVCPGQSTKESENAGDSNA